MLRRILIITSYLVVTIAIVITTIVLVAYGQGYSYNFRTRSFNLNGLLVLESSPQGADIAINGRDIHRKTPYRATMEAGEYDIEVKRAGYRPWHKKVRIKASEVTAVPAIVFVPDNLKTEVLTSEDTVTNFVASKDHRNFAYITAGANHGVWLMSPDRKQGTKIYTPRPAAGDVAAEVVTNVTWSDDASHLLLRTQLGSVVNYLIIPTGGGTAINLTDLFKFDLAGMQFNPSDWRELYWISPEGLRRINVEAQTVTAVLVDKISAFTFAGDRLVYVQSTPLGKTLWSSDKSGKDPKRLIESLAESDIYQMQYANYRGKDFLAVLPQKASTVTIYSDIFSATPVAKILSKSASQIGFNENGRYLAFYSPTEFGTYDTDKDVIATTSFDGPLAQATWFDPAHLIISRAGLIELIDYDGANRIKLGDGRGAAFGTNDQRRVLWMSGPDGALRLVMVEIKS
jgi:hypothetical protein